MIPAKFWLDAATVIVVGALAVTGAAALIVAIVDLAARALAMM